MPCISTATTRLAAHVLRRPVYAARRYASNSASDPVESDVVIVGGGVAGLALASALGSSPSVQKRLTVTLIEGGDLHQVHAWMPQHNAFSNRVVSITNRSRSFLKDIGVWDFVDESRICSLKQMQVWDGVSDARIGFNSDDLLSDATVDGMATIVENLNLQRSLMHHLRETSAVKILQRTRVASINTDEETRGSWPLVRLDNDIILRARLLVGADGFNSPVRSFAQIPSYGWPYNTKAIVCTMLHSPRGAFEAPNATAYQRFLPSGPIAFLPLTPTVSSLVWSTTPELAAALLSCDPMVLTTMINAAFRLPNISMNDIHNFILAMHAKGGTISPETVTEEVRFREMSHGINEHSAYSAVRKASDQQGVPPAESEAVPPLVVGIQEGTIASFPIRYNHAETYLGEGSRSRTVLVGDAAHTIHPLAGQGMNLGLGDVECLTRCIVNSLGAGGDIGSHTSLLPYAQERYLANHVLMSTIDKLHKLYGTDNETVVWARSTGMEVLNELDSIKVAMMTFAGAENSRLRDPSSMAWNCAGSAIESMAGTLKTAGFVKDSISGALLGVLGNLVKPSRP